MLVRGTNNPLGPRLACIPGREPGRQLTCSAVDPRLRQRFSLEAELIPGQSHSRPRLLASLMQGPVSHGQVNIFNLAKNVGTSVEQIERFCARNLPFSPELAKNLQSFGE
jgi:hypothetical protein